MEETPLTAKEVVLDRRNTIVGFVFAVLLAAALGSVVTLYVTGDWREGDMVTPPLVSSPSSPPASPSLPVTPKRIVHTSFAAPYFSWRPVPSEDATIFVTGVSLETDTVNPDSDRTLTFNLKVRYGNTTVCLDTGMRRLVNEEGDFAAPTSGSLFQFPNRYGSCGEKYVTYDNQKVIFNVPAHENDLIFTTGWQTNIFFTVRILSDDHIQIEPSERRG